MLSRLRIALFASLILALVAGVLTPAYAKATPDSFADLAEKLLPSVVNISTTQTIVERDYMDGMQAFPFPEGSPFEDFFQEFMEQQGQPQKRGKEESPAPKNKKTRKHKATSLGSGFIIDATGFIVTNYHVIKDADEVSVILQDDTKLKATVVGKDKKTDLALLKVSPQKPLNALTWGESDKIRVGDWIIAIGNPFGLGGTVTAGIISARARDINSGPYDDYLQTDAPINRGNSGGPMFNMNGEVIGINTAIFSPSGGSIGIGFAIPSQMAKGVIEQIKTSGHTRRGWIGVHIQTVTEEIAQGLGIGKARGALVSSVAPNSPSTESKLQVGDVIIKFNDKEITEMHRLPRIVAETEVGKTVPITVLRKGKEISLEIKVAELDPKDEEQTDEEDTEEVEKPIKKNEENIEELGLTAAPIDEAQRKRYNIGKNVTGVVVTRIAPNGIAAEQGLRSGDVISEVSQQDIASPKDLNNLINEAKKEGKPLLILLNRKGEMRFLAIELEKNSK